MTEVLRGLFGLIVLIALLWAFSLNRKGVDWRLVVVGLFVQFGLALSVLKFHYVQLFFETVGKAFIVILDFTKEGTQFLFPGFLDIDKFGFVFAFQILPTIIFFSALTSLLYYLGIIQIVVRGLAWLMTRAFRISGAESLSVAGNIFLGQTESPLLIKKYLSGMTNSEIMLVMIGGMATMAGGVLAAYIAFLGGDDPVQRLLFAKHLLAASIMAAPGAVVAAKILAPQTVEIDSEAKVSEGELGINALDAVSKGTADGLRLAANIGAMLLVFVAFIAMANFLLMKFGGWTGLNDAVSAVSDGRHSQLSLQVILGYVFAPVVWSIGVVSDDITLVGRLLGEKLVMTEFIGYKSLSELKLANAFASEKSIIISTYLLCGFANIASIGIQIGGIGLLAPNKRELLAQYGMRALLGGTVAALFSATMVGMIL
ncbi:MAG: Na+ dependent nucleoside transporter [Gammaproteobacteria bacterium]|nr:Na+ dependent nucleoside transporter [Gammaproteobacteria bacterium]